MTDRIHGFYRCGFALLQNDISFLHYIYIGHQRVGDVAAEELFGVLCRNQVAELLGIHYQVRKIIKLAQNIFGQLHTMFLQELVQEILLIFVFSVIQ